MLIFDARFKSVESISLQNISRTRWGRIVSAGWLRDTLWLNDISMQSMRLLNADGSVAREAKIYWPDSTLGPFVRTAASVMLADGTALIRPGLAASGSDNTIVGEPLLRMSISNEVLDTLAWISTTHIALELRNDRFPERGLRFATQPFGDWPLVTSPPDGSAIVIVDRALSSTTGRVRAYFVLTSIAPKGDTIFSKHFAYTPVGISPRKIKHVVDSTAQALIKESTPLFDDAGESRGIIEQQLYLPGFYAPVSDIVVGRDHSIWLRREASAELVKWELIDALGRRSGSLQMPVAMRIISGNRDSVVIMLTKKDHTVAFQRFRILRRVSSPNSHFSRLN